MKATWKYTCIGLYFLFIIGVYLTEPPTSIVDTIAAFVVPAIVLTMIYYMYIALGRAGSLWASDLRSKGDAARKSEDVADDKDR